MCCIVGVRTRSGTGNRSTETWAWGATGHEWVSGIAIDKLPDSVPAFIRTPEAAAEIAVMGRELDRSKTLARRTTPNAIQGTTLTWPTMAPS